ncbi:MAG: TRAP transporter substrate-binding protein DctP [Chloroflexi bacterium]|nr:TRAP transporter substrate-binding protein DctP [Chloroflexota bacterium]
MSNIQPADSPEGRATDVLAKRVQELTHGEITLNAVHGGQLATDSAAGQQIQNGTIDMAAIGMWTNLIKADRVFELPYVFSSREQVRKVLDGPPGQTVKESASGTGAVLLDWYLLTWRSRPTRSTPWRAPCSSC